MVEYETHLNKIFYSLANPTRRDILKRLARCEVLSIGDIAEHYKLTFAAISKHIKVLENATLIIKKRSGQNQMVAIHPKTIEDANHYLREYEKLWSKRFDKLEILLKEQ